MYKVATFFDKENWEKYGKDWSERAKSQNLSGFLIVTEPVDLEISNFEIVVSKNYLNIFSSFSSKLTEPCLFTRPDQNPVADISVNSEVFCSTRKDIDFFRASERVSNLYDRASIIKLLQKNYLDKKVFSFDYVLGSSFFWKSYSGFKNCLFRNEFFVLAESPNKDYEDLILNIFFSIFDFSVETF